MTADNVQELDARGLLCPLPVLKARRALRSVPPGGILRVLATDPGAPRDFVHFCETTGTDLVSVDAGDAYTAITIRRPPG